MSVRISGRKPRQPYLAAIRGTCSPDLFQYFSHELIDIVRRAQLYAFTPVESRKSLLGCTPQPLQPGLLLGLLQLKQAETSSHSLARIAESPLGNPRLNEAIVMLGQIDIACWHPGASS